MARQRMVLNQVERQHQALLNQQHALSVEPNPDSFCQQTLEDQIVSLRGGIAQRKGRMSQLVGEHYQQALRLLESIPGFGPVTAVAFLEVPSGFELSLIHISMCIRDRAVRARTKRHCVPLADPTRRCICIRPRMQAIIPARNPSR